MNSTRLEQLKQSAGLSFATLRRFQQSHIGLVLRWQSAGLYFARLRRFQKSHIGLVLRWQSAGLFFARWRGLLSSPRQLLKRQQLAKRVELEQVCFNLGGEG